METENLLDVIIETAKNIKAFNIKKYDLRELQTYTEYAIIISVSNDRQAKALSENIRFAMKQRKILPLGIEGEGQSWVLMDYDEVIVHIFEDSQRIFYDLERLWKDLPHESIK